MRPPEPTNSNMTEQSAFTDAIKFITVTCVRRTWYISLVRISLQKDCFTQNTPEIQKIFSSMKLTVIRNLSVSQVYRMAFILLHAFFATGSAEDKPPHIIFIIADDLGWNDVSFHGSPQIPTPNIDALAASGIILNRHYVAPQCTPSRASLMTGRYPTNTGLHHNVITAIQPTGLPLNFTIMPQYLKTRGYATHLVGKWHLGYFKKVYTPTYRGFDSFFGYWNGGMDYYDHTNYGISGSWGIDFHDGMETVRDLQGKYAVELFTERAEQIIRNHNETQPLFLLLSQIAVHTGNRYQRQQSLPKYFARFGHIKDFNRRMHAGVVSALDDSVGNIVAALDAKGFLDNSIIVFVSDNGAEAEGQDGGHGSNWPLKGSKMSLFEGAVRVPALIWSPLLRLKEPKVSEHLMHISDWLPTLYAAAGGDERNMKETDGLNMWSYLTNDLPFPRNEILLNVDPIFGMSSLILGDYKLVNGSYPEDYRNGWYGPSGRDDFNVSSIDDWVWGKESIVKDILQKNGRWLLKTPDKWRLDATVNCSSSSTHFSEVTFCDPVISPCLFNIIEDPCEYHNLASQYPEVVKHMMHRISQLNSTSPGPIVHEDDHNADPRCHDFSYVPWLDKEHITECYV